MRIHGESSPRLSGCHDICTVRKTRSGCGIMIVKRPSAVVTPGDAGRRAVRVVGIDLGRIARVVEVTHGDQRARLLLGRVELGAPFAVRDDDRHAAARHAAEEQRRRFRQLDHREARLELLDLVALETRPGVGAGNQRLQRAHHLAAVADAEREGVVTAEESRELVARARIEQDGARPALAGAKHVAVGEAATGDAPLKSASATRPARMSLICTSTAAKPARSKAAAISTWPLTPCSRRMATLGRAPLEMNGAAMSSAGSKVSATERPASAWVENAVELLLRALRVVTQAPACGRSFPTRRVADRRASRRTRSCLAR
jgi:hypothetical protein